MNPLDLLNQLALSGGDWVVYLLFLASLLSVYVMGERYLYFSASAGYGQRVHDAAIEALGKGDVESACAKLKGLPCPEARILSVGLSAHANGTASVQQRTQSQLIKEKAALDKNLAVLGTVGSTAPFVGLFGTVLGVIKAFHELSLQGAGASNAVMRGISEALIATAVGIMVAIPALVAYNYFKNRVKGALAAVESLNCLALSYLTGGPGA